MKLLHFYMILLLSTTLIFSCQNNYSSDNAASQNDAHGYPPATGFNLDSSDAEAILIADEVMKAQGGYQNWKATRYISWTFLNGRKLLWDKWEGDVRIEDPKDSTITLVNVHDSTGKVMKNGKLITDIEEKQKYLNQGITIWINDSYWLVMPFKLKDSGVTLKYMGEGMTTDNTAADILRLTFEDVGVSPEHKYLIYVDKKTRLVSQWNYFTSAKQQKPVFTTPWLDYQKYGNIMLSGSRGKASLKDIEVLEKLSSNRLRNF